MTLGLFGFGIQNWNRKGANQNLTAGAQRAEISKIDETRTKKEVHPDFLLKVEARFLATISKEKLNQALTIKDLVPEKATKDMCAFNDVHIFFENGSEKKIEIGNNERLNDKQRELLASLDYSNDFHIEATCSYQNPETGKMEPYDFVYYISVVPEKQAEYSLGSDALLQYLRDNSQKEIDRMSGDRLQPGRIQFTVTSSGEVKNVSLNSTSGFMHLDVAYLDLIPKTTGKWEPALNAKGEKINQQFIFFYGIEGC